MGDVEASDGLSRSTVFDSSEDGPVLDSAEESRTVGRLDEPQREPLEHTRLCTLECEWAYKDSVEGEATTLIRYQSPAAGLSWTLDVRVGDPEDDDDSSLRLLLHNVQAERPENLCIKVEVVVSTRFDARAAVKGSTVKKLFKGDGELLVVDEVSELHDVSFAARVSTHYRNTPCGPCADWARLRSMRELAEVTFLLGDVAIPAHKQVLCARSPVFRSMFTLDFKEAKEMVVTVEDAPWPEAFEKFLEYLYSGQVQDFEQMELQVMLIADRYQVEGLKVLCQREMFDKVNTANVLDTLVLADKVNAVLLKKNALSVAVDKIGVVMTSPAWKDFHKEHNDLVDDMLKEAIMRNVSF
ncbi:speckle-type POZ protein homolog isoform X4 [Frankliniella occidentalis]|uniref:Speckle-type POZ protein homolog isoform X1 n=1 Tax=Frankliniella occidentalis TaxID=133901 RepID=A0A6J1TDH9_FRAOC|nr:speckle-type POZ protein homolog isoform X5 [Frankliniella occidentalis]XP_052127308.1 speckle-type POZ protein homolog isoform X1 [Frankliniella occidentalis]XP_052127309.1 speckle-type POZ protein homolog isoform X2 [Frankliniella occidentalis]XP_052127310.1 speckle-type POZ protein homolog isoform X3 [Frankliniella occidentalis]XP_052127311.1 speckle-type POZ protein homolog isoform X4 [Frankliniella occidentalis]